MANDLIEGVPMDDERIETLLEAGCPPELVSLLADLPAEVDWHTEPSGGNAQFMHVKASPSSAGAIYVDHRHMSVALTRGDAEKIAHVLGTKSRVTGARSARVSITPDAVATTGTRLIAIDALERSIRRSAWREDDRRASLDTTDQSDASDKSSSDAQIDIPCVLLRVSRLWSVGMHIDDIYDITRGWWKIGPKREQALFALAVADGVVRAVFEIHEWQPRLLDDDGSPITENPRWGFDGEPATDQQHLVGLDVRHLFPQGAANPVRYLNIDNDESPSDSGATVDKVADDPTWTSAVLAIPSLSVRHHDVMTHCEWLANEPLLAASLHSKELFHSNLIGWVLERSPDIALDALSPWLQTDVDQADWFVLREHRHLDLVVAIPGQSVIVIENKVFSSPDESQLERYDLVNIKRAGITNPTKLLLSLIDPGWPDGSCNGWRWVPLRTLVERVVAAAVSRFDGFKQEFLDRWLRLVAALDEIANATAPTDPNAPHLLEKPIVELLAPLRMHDAFGKARNYSMRRRVVDQLARVGLEVHRVDANFTNGAPILSAYFEMPDGSEIGWQLQHSQWRRCVIPPEELHGRSMEDIARRERYVHDLFASWMDFSAEQAAGPFGPAPTDSFKHYSPNFVYDYIRVPNITIGKVLELAEIATREAHALRTRMNAKGTSAQQ